MSKYPYVARGAQANQYYYSQEFNIDNGNGTTIDDVMYCPHDIEVVAIRPLYTEATDTSGVASANYKVGTAAAGAEIVAATALEISKAVGAAGAKATLVASTVAAGSSLFIRHTGIAATEGGKYKVLVEYRVKP